MGTRNLIIVWHRFRFRIVQYAQYDGYPSGQGATVLEFLKEKGNVDRLRKALDTPGAIFEVEDEDGDYPSMSSLTGAKILQLAAEATAEKPIPIYLAKWFVFDTIFCEWIWLLDLDMELFTCYMGYKWKDGSVDSDRFELLRLSMEMDDYRDPDLAAALKATPRPIHRWSFGNLPEDTKTMVEQISQRANYTDPSQHKEEEEEELGTATAE